MMDPDGMDEKTTHIERLEGENILRSKMRWAGMMKDGASASGGGNGGDGNGGCGN